MKRLCNWHTPKMSYTMTKRAQTVEYRYAKKVTVAARRIFNMATSDIPVLRQMDKQFLNCGICQERYRNPKVLPCLHTFCECCLSSYIPAESLSVTCPICRQQSILPQEGVSALQNNFLINNLVEAQESTHTCSICNNDKRAMSKCLDCCDFLCEECTNNHNNQQQNGEMNGEIDDIQKPHRVVSLNELAMSDNPENEESSLSCPNHVGGILQYYCSSCETAVCETCTRLEHVSHETTLLKDAIEEQKVNLQELMERAQATAPSIKQAVTLVSEVVESLQAKCKQTEEQINDIFDQISQMLTERRSTLLSELELTHNAKQQTLMEQKEMLENVLTNIYKSCEVTDNALKHGNETEILLVKKEVAEKLSEIVSPDIQVMPEENDCLIFEDIELKHLQGNLNRLGGIRTNSVVSFETTATGDGLRSCAVGRNTLITVTTKDRHGNLIKVGGTPVTATITMAKGQSIIPQVIDNANGTYDLIYLVPEEGKHELDIRTYNQPIKGSPFKFKATQETSDNMDRPSSSKIPKTSPVKQKGTKRPPSSISRGSNRKSNPIEDDLIFRAGVKGRNKGEFTNPQGVCSTSDNKIIVADSNNQFVQVFNDKGDCKLKFGKRGRNPGEMQRPTGVAISKNGNYIVADYDNKWVSIYSPEGKYINKIGAGKLLGPKGVTIDNNGHIIVVDNKASCVCIFQSNGKFIKKFGSRGNEEHNFAGPHFVAVNTQNDIIVSDFHNHCIKVFDSEGEFLFSFGSNGVGNGQFNAPTGVAVDSLGNILVADWGNSRIQVFDSQGSFLSYINTHADPLYGPQGLALLENGNIVVSDSGNHCFKMYRYLQ
ncbi:unnamed protein product [Owenia fusiformis]|uniref:Tripartite motif-containing protein 2-like n=1 Tax=Owenia fusiformis TaxID=6347 RepID=A0A8J1XK14_OWEFU|nr:unnamed protein product [Owenia fusiformis]